MRKNLIFALLIFFCGCLVASFFLLAGRAQPVQPTAASITFPRSIASPVTISAPVTNEGKVAPTLKEGPAPLKRADDEDLSRDAELRKQGRWELSGEAVDENKQPVPSPVAILQLMSGRARGAELLNSTAVGGDADGHFSFGGDFPPAATGSGLLALVRLQHRDFASTQEEVSIPTPGLYRLQLALRTSGEGVVTGTVLNLQQVPLSGIQVRLLAASTGQSFLSQPTLGDGVFKIVGAGPGQYQVEAEAVVAENQARKVPVVRPTELSAEAGGETGVNIVLDYDAQQGSISGHVVNEEKTGIAKATVHMHLPDGVFQIITDDSGAFAFANLSPDLPQVELRVYHTDYSDGDFSVRMGSSDAKLMLSPKPRVTCKLIAVDSKQKPVPEAEVRVDDLEAAWQPMPKGEVILDVSAGHHVFWVQARGYNQVTVPADVDEDKANEIVAELGEATELQVGITFQGPLREAVGTDDLILLSGKLGIIVQSANSEQALVPERDSPNSVVFRVGKGVAYVVRVQLAAKLGPQSSAPEEISAISEPVSIAPDTTEPVRVHLTLGGDCQVTGAAPSAGCTEVELMREGSVAPGSAQGGLIELGYTESRAASIDSEGQFVFGALLPGAYTAICYGRDEQGNAKTFKAQVVVSQAGEVAQIQWQ